MPEIFKLSNKQATALSLDFKLPEGFRFARSKDFMEGNCRIKELTIFVRMGEFKLQEYWFTCNTNRNFMQWLLNNNRVLIKTGNQIGESKKFTYILTPKDSFLRDELGNQFRS